jgi:SAM-dependent methyltransferase
MAVDQGKFMEFVFRCVGDLGATVSAAGVVIGHRLGLYRALTEGPATPAGLAGRTGTDERYVAEWLAGQAAGGYVEHDPATGAFSLTPEQAFALADPDSPVNVPGAFMLALGALRAEPRIAEAFRTGAGVGWHEQDGDVFDGCEQFFRPGYRAHLVADWLPAMDGVVGKLRSGARVADVGCGLGASTLLLAAEYPMSTFAGSDYHQGSVDAARKRAAEAGAGDRVRFEVASARDFTGTGYDLVTTFDCLHDMGDPAGAARHIRESLAPDGHWLIVEPMAGTAVADNLNPVGRVYYGFSTLLCVPNARSQGFSEPGHVELGAQAGEPTIASVVRGAGFSGFQRIAETPFNIVYEARP